MSAVSFGILGLGFVRAAVGWPPGQFDLFGYTWNAYLTVGVSGAFVGLYLANRDKSRELDSRERATPKIEVVKARVLPMAPEEQHPDRRWYSGRITVLNDTHVGEAKATDVRAHATFEPADEMLQRLHTTLAESGRPAPPEIDCRWASGYGHAGAIELNPSQERELDIAIKWESDLTAYAFDDRSVAFDDRTQTWVMRNQGRVPGYELYRGTYAVRVTITGNFPPVNRTVWLTNPGQGQGISLELEQST